MRGRSFGRRGVARHVPAQAAVAASSSAVMFEPALDGVQGAGQTAQAAAQELSPEQELEAWKAERMRTRLSRMPWRQIYLMAGLCFGIAGFVLPDSINDTASWLLYGLAAASFYASFLRRRQRATAS